MKKGKQVLSFCLALLFAFFLTACTNDSSASSSTGDSTGEGSGTSVIGGTSGIGTSTSSSTGENPNENPNESAPSGGDSSTSTTTTKINENSNSGSSQNQTTAEAKKNLNFSGQTVTIAYTYTPEAKGESAAADRWYRRIEEVEKKFNVKIETKLGSSKYGDVIVSSILSGKPMGHVMMSGNNINWLTAGIMCDLTEASKQTGIDFTSDIYNQNIRKYFTLNGKTYIFGYSQGAVIDIWLYNKKIFKQMSLPDPHTLYKNGQWTWDKVTEIAKKATKRDNAGTVTQWGLAMSLMGNVMTSLMAENGGFVAAVNKKGEPIITMGDTACKEAMEQLQKWAIQDKVLLQNAGTSYDWANKEFTKGYIAMLATTSIVYLEDMNDDWGMIYPPCGPSNKNGNKSLVDLGESFFIPITYQKDAGKYLLLMDELNQPYADADEEKLFKEKYMGRFRDSNSYNVWKTMNLDNSKKIHDPYIEMGVMWDANSVSLASLGEQIGLGTLSPGVLVETYVPLMQNGLTERYKGYTFTLFK